MLRENANNMCIGVRLTDEMYIKDICSCVYVYMHIGVYLTLFAYVHVCAYMYACVEVSICLHM